MSLIQPLILPNVQNVASDSTMTVSLPVGNHTYSAIELVLSGTIAKTDITNLMLEVNGKPLQLFKTVADLEAVSQFYNYPIVATRVRIPLSREHLTLAEEKFAFNFGAADIATLTLRADIGTVVGTFGVTAETEKWVNTTQGLDPESLKEANALGRVTKIKNFVASATGAGELQIDKIPREQFISAIHLGSSAINSVKLELDSVKVWDRSLAGMVAFNEARKSRTRQNNFYHLDFMPLDELGTALPVGNRSDQLGVQDMRLILDMSGASTINIMVEYLSGFGGI